MKKLFSVFAVLVLYIGFCPVWAANIYVQDQTGWSNLYLYSYINDGDAIHGKWPGATAIRTETINGVACPVFDFTIPSAGSYFLIFNNGSGAQTPDFAAKENRDYYLVVTTGGCREVQRSDIEPAPLPEPKQANNYIVYQANEKIFATTAAFAAIEARLDEIQALSVNVLWLMPIHPVGQKNTVNSPYCVKDFKGINTNFGNLADLQSLVNAAHARGMKVILDWVANHSALDHPWVTEHPEWYGTPSGDEKNWNDVKPFDFNNASMRLAMIDAMTYWMRTADIDGFRCDFAQGCSDDFWGQAIDSIRSIKQDAIMLAETSRTQLYSRGFDWMYSWSYLSAIQNLFTTGSLSNLYNRAASEMNSTPDGKERLRYITNHDACSERANSDIYISADGMLAAACLTYFLEGVPLIYSSQEIGYLKKIAFCCTSSASVKMNWNSNPTCLAATKRLMSAYRISQPLRGGARTIHTTNAKVACYTFTSEEGTLLVVANTDNGSQALTLPEAVAGKTMQDLLNGGTKTLGTTLSVPAFGYYVLALSENPLMALPQQTEQPSGHKFLRDGKLFIERNGRIFDVSGMQY